MPGVGDGERTSPVGLLGGARAPATSRYAITTRLRDISPTVPTVCALTSASLRRLPVALAVSADAAFGGERAMTGRHQAVVGVAIDCAFD